MFKPGPLAVTFNDVIFSYQDSISLPPEAAARAADRPVSEPVMAVSASADYQKAVQSEAEQAREIERVLCGISFGLGQGRVMGLLGRTGSGKTTLTRLLFRLYDPDSGRICLTNAPAYHGAAREEQDIRDIPVQELRRRIGMVTQNIQLFHATVRENLSFFDSSIPDEKIIEAIHDLGLTKWYASLPKGLDTELESGGGGLSAGEAQLLAFTRIFLRDPGLVILDEATSRLDPATEHLIEQAVDKLVRNRTAIIVAHRLGTVQRADDILILENGEVVEFGERTALIENPSSHFSRLLQTGLEEVLA